MIAKKCLGLVSIFVVGALPTLFVSGCRLGPRSDENAAHVRLIDAVPDVGGLTVSVDGQRAWKETPFRGSTGYQGVTSGTYPVRLDSSVLDGALMRRSLSFEKGHDYTVLALAGNAGRAAQMLVWEDESQARRDPGKAAVRLVNAAPGLGPVDLVVNNIVGLKAIPYGRRSLALPLDGGAYDLEIAAADTPDALGEPIRLRLEVGHSYTLIAMGRAADQTLSLEAYPDAR